MNKIVFSSILFVIFSCSSTADRNDYSIALGENDVTVFLNIRDADSSLNTIIFSTDIWNEIIIVQLDSLNKNDHYSIGYKCRGESAFLVKAIFKDDTVSYEGYAENGYEPSLLVNAKEFEVIDFK
jgi:hypothetical protein